MKNNRIISIFLMIILFVCAALLDYGYNRFEDIFASQPQFTPLYVYKFFASLLWAAMMLGVTWYVLVVNPRNQSVALTYLLVGVLVLFLASFSFALSYLLAPLAQLTQGIRMQLMEIFISRLSLTIHTAAMIVVIGAAGLLPDRLLRPARTDTNQEY